MKYEWLKALNQIKMKVSGNCSGHFSLPFWVSIEVEKNLENNWNGKRRITLSSDRFSIFLLDLFPLLFSKFFFAHFIWLNGMEKEEFLLLQNLRIDYIALDRKLLFRSIQIQIHRIFFLLSQLLILELFYDILNLIF